MSDTDVGNDVGRLAYTPRKKRWILDSAVRNIDGWVYRKEGEYFKTIQKDYNTNIINMAKRETLLF